MVPSPIQNLETCVSCIHDIISHQASHYTPTKSHTPLQQSIIKGCLREYLGFKAIITQQCRIKRKDHKLITLMVCVLYQTHRLEKAPVASLIDAACNLCHRYKKTSAKPLVYAVLKRLTKTAPPNPSIKAEASSWAKVCAPEWLSDYLSQAIGDDYYENWCEQWLEPPKSLWLRAQASLQPVKQTIEELKQDGSPPEPVNDLPLALQIPQGPTSQLRSLHHQSVYIQNITNQRMIAIVPVPSATIKVLDCCASPGGKSTALLDQHSHIQLCANDVSTEKIARLKANLKPWQSRVSFTCHDFRLAPLTHACGDPMLFDMVWVDAPCSALGTLKRKPDVKFSQSTDNISQLQTQQKKILGHAWENLKPGGRLVYSTCTLGNHENQAIIQYHQSKTSAVSVMLHHPLAQQAPPGIIFLPSGDADGGFLCMLEKPVDNTD